MEFRPHKYQEKAVDFLIGNPYCALFVDMGLGKTVATLTAIPENMKKAAQKGFINATDLADYLVKKGMPFRSAYKISGQLVARCIRENTVLEELPLEVYRQCSELFDQDVFQEIDLTTCVEKRISEGGTSVSSVEAQIAYVKENLV